MKLGEQIKQHITFSNILTLVSLILAYVFYKSAEKEREPIYSIHDSSIVIYDSKNTSNSIKLLSKDSVIIQENVYLNEIVLWNQGNISIMPEDVRDTLKLTLRGVKEILDYKIVAESHISSHFKLFQINFNTLGIDWMYFDPSNAVKFHIIYTGEKFIEPIWTASIVSVDFIKPYKRYNKIKDWSVSIVVAVLLLIFFYKIEKAVIPKNKEIEWILKTLLFTGLITGIVTIILKYFIYNIKIPL